MKRKVIILLALVMTFGLVSRCSKKEKDSDKSKVTVQTIVKTYSGDEIRTSGVHVHLFKQNEDDDDYIGVKDTDSDGKVVFKDLESGNYSIEAEYDQNGEYRYGETYFSLGKGEDKTITVRLIH